MASPTRRSKAGIGAAHVPSHKMESDDDLENNEDASVMPERAMEEVETPPDFLGGLKYSITIHFVCIHKTLNFKSSFLTDFSYIGFCPYVI
jgi:hypothetical protein